jgi:hypothetical protein
VKEVRQNSVSFITFNYDRSLEHFLFAAAKDTYGASDEDALTTVKSMRIIHVYGSLAEYDPNPRKGARAYINHLTGEAIELAADGIRVIPEAREGDPVFRRAGDLVRACERLCFLGFGFDFLNLDRLNLPEVLHGTHQPPTVFASALDKTQAEMNAYRARICGTEPDWLTFAAKNSLTIRESGVLL